MRLTPGRIGWLLLFCAAFFAAGTVLSIGEFGISVPLAVGVVGGGLVALMLVRLALLTTPAAWRDRRKRVDQCPHCRYTVPSAGDQLCPECGRRSVEAERKPGRAVMPCFWDWCQRSVAVCLCGFTLAAVLTAGECATAWSFGRAAVRAAVHPPAPGAWRGALPMAGWVMDIDTVQSVRGGWICTTDSSPNGVIFRAARWTPWPHLIDLFYAEDSGGRGHLIWNMD